MGGVSEQEFKRALGYANSAIDLLRRATAQWVQSDPTGALEWMLASGSVDLCICASDHVVRLVNRGFDARIVAGLDEHYSYALLGGADFGAGGTEMIPEAMVNWDGTDTDWIAAVLEPAALQRLRGARVLGVLEHLLLAAGSANQIERGLGQRQGLPNEAVGKPTGEASASSRCIWRSKSDEARRGRRSSEPPRASGCWGLPQLRHSVRPEPSGNLLDVVYQGEELPLGIYLGASAQSEAPHALVL